MTSHDQQYYQEFRDLLTRIQSAVSDLKEKNERLSIENREFSSELKDVRGQLTDAHREIDRLNSELAEKSTEKNVPDPPAVQPGLDTEPTEPAHGVDSGSASAFPTLFDSLDDNEKRILRQQIIELIARIDKHLDRACSTRTSESS